MKFLPGLLQPIARPVAGPVQGSPEGGEPALPVVPAYQWRMIDSADFGGRLVPNTGSYAISPPYIQCHAGSGAVLDADGSYTHVRSVWDPSVVDPLGNNEAVVMTFTALNQHNTLLSRFDNPDTGSVDFTTSIRVKKVGAAAAKLVLGSNSDSGTHASWRNTFNATDDWVEVEANATGWSSAAAYHVVLRPAPDAVLPFTVAVYAPMIRDAGSDPKPNLFDFRLSRHSGHAFAPFALPNSITVNPAGGMISTNRTKNVVAELAPEVVTHHAMSAWIKVDTLPGNRGHFMGFSRTENPTESADGKGVIGIYGSAEDQDFRGRLKYQPGGNFDKQLYSPHFDGSGWMHVHINYGHDGSDAAIGVGEVAHELLINGIPFHERSSASLISFIPRLLSLGGQDTTQKQQQRGAGAFENLFEMVRYEPNTRISRSEVLKRVIADRAAFAEIGAEPLDALVIVEGDSTSQQRGSPMYMYSRTMRKPGRLFVQHARGGSWYQGGISSNSDYIGTRQRRTMRRQAMKNGITLGYSKVFTLWTPGENDGNGNGLLGVGADVNIAVQTFTDFILADLVAVDPTRERTRSIFVSMKMSDFAADVKSQVRAYWAALDAIYTEQVDPVNAPFLYRAPDSYAGPKHDYFIAMHKWAPTNGSYTWADWEALAIDAKAGVNGARDIISSDGQHWTQGWNPHVSDAVHIPCLTKIFELEGVD